MLNFRSGSSSNSGRLLGTATLYASFWFTSGAILLMTGCSGSGSQWVRLQRPPTYRPPPTLHVLILVHAKGEDIGEAATTLRDELTSRLRSDGIQATVVTAPPPPPFARVDIAHWTPGNRGDRWATGIWGDDSGQAVIVVDFAMEGNDSSAPLSGRVRGYVKSGAWGGSAMGAAEEAADAIADVIAGHRIGE